MGRDLQHVQVDGGAFRHAAELGPQRDEVDGKVADGEDDDDDQDHFGDLSPIVDRADRSIDGRPDRRPQISRHAEVAYPDNRQRQYEQSDERHHGVRFTLFVRRPFLQTKPLLLAVVEMLYEFGDEDDGEEEDERGNPDADQCAHSARSRPENQLLCCI